MLWCTWSKPIARYIIIRTHIPAQSDRGVCYIYHSEIHHRRKCWVINKEILNYTSVPMSLLRNLTITLSADNSNIITMATVLNPPTIVITVFQYFISSCTANIIQPDWAFNWEREMEGGRVSLNFYINSGVILPIPWTNNYNLKECTELPVWNLAFHIPHFHP